MTINQLLIVVLGVVGSVSCTVCASATLYLIYVYRGMEPYARIQKRVLALEASLDELLRQIEVLRKSYAGVRSAAAKKKAQPDDDLNPDTEQTREALREIAARGGI